MTGKTIIVTNDFPPRQGGIQSFVHALAVRLPSDSLVVYASTYGGADEFDAQQPFPVVRHPAQLLVPTPAARRRVVATAREHGATAAWFGACAPLGLLAAALKSDAAVTRCVATTHGHEVAWAMLPAARQALRRIGNTCDVITYLGEYTHRRLNKAFGPRPAMRRMTPGVDADMFHPSVDGTVVRERYGLGDRPVVVCVSRLVKRKGQDALIDALAEIRRRVPDTALLIVGQGPYLDGLRVRARERGLDGHVVFTGGVPWAELPAHYAAGDVFAMPCRTRRAGMDVEGLGIVFLEASAVGLPVVAGDSGGAPDAVRDGETGHVVDGRNLAQLTDTIASLLEDPAEARALGKAGRAWVEQQWTWDHSAATLRELLDAH